MSPTIKIVVAIVPIIIAAYVGMTMLQPAMDEASTKDKSVAEKQQESDGLQAKLGDPAKINQKQKQFEQEINQLRDAVPKAPDIDLLTIDLERMCKEAGMDLIAIKSPNKDLNAPAAVDSSSYLKKKQDRLKNALKGNGGADDAAAGAASAGPPPNELEETTKQIVVTGDYNGLQKLVHELETYQRVIKINDIVSRVPKLQDNKKEVKLPDESEPNASDKLGDPNMLYISMNITTYYLP